MVGALCACGGDARPTAADDGSAAKLAYELLVAPDAKSPGVLEYLELSELEAAHRGRRVKVHGLVADAPIERRTDGTGHRFTMVQDATTLVVEHTGALPDRFQPKLEVIVTGTLSDDGTRIATDELVAKCPETYDDGTKAPR